MASRVYSVPITTPPFKLPGKCFTPGCVRPQAVVIIEESQMPSPDEARTLTDADVAALADEIEKRDRRRRERFVTADPRELEIRRAGSDHFEPLRASNHFYHPEAGEEPLIKGGHPTE